MSESDEQVQQFVHNNAEQIELLAKTAQAQADMLRAETASELNLPIESIRQLANVDALTLLLNRGALERRIKSRLNELDPGELCALFIVDLDHFKEVNDTLGHQAGDRVLQEAARVLQGLFRTGDVVGRLGGDEFAVFIAGAITEELVRRKSELICEQLQLHVSDDPPITITASVGAYFVADGERRFSFLYRSVDKALYKAKNAGKHTYTLVTSSKGEAEEKEIKNVSPVRMRDLLDNIDSGVALITISDKPYFSYVSPAFAKMLDLTPPELTSCAVLDFVYPEDRWTAAQLITTRVAENGDTGSRPLRVVGMSGEVMWWRIHAVRVEEPGSESPVVMITAIDITEMKEQSSDLQSIFNLVMSQATQGAWEVDLNSMQFRMMGDNHRFPAALQNPLPFPDGLLETGWIHRDSVDSFTEFARSIMTGREQGYANFKIKYREDGKYGWASFSYRTVTDVDGHPVRIVGMIDSITRGTDQSRPEDVALPELLLPSMVLQAAGDLTDDELSLLWVEGQNRTIVANGSSCSDFLERERLRVPEWEKREAFSDFFSRQSLIKAAGAQTTLWLRREFYRVDETGTIRWVACTVNLYNDTETGHLRMALWTMDLEQRRRWERLYALPISKTPTGLYTRLSTRDICTRLLTEDQHKLCALTVIELRGLNKIAVRTQEEPGMLIQAVTSATLLGLGGMCLPGRMGAGRLVIFFPEITSRSALERQLEQAMRYVRGVMQNRLPLSDFSFVISGACRYQDEVSADSLMRLTMIAHRHFENASGDCIFIATENEEADEGDDTEGWEDITRSEAGDRVRVSGTSERPLSDREKEAAFNCLLNIMNADNIKDAAKSVLTTIGNFYDADRVYIMEFADDGRVITVPHEWTAAHRRSIQSVLSGAAAADYPLLQRCIREDRAIFLSRDADKDDPKRSAWHFAVIPIREAGNIVCYLCMENAQNHITDATFPALLCDCLMKERRKHMRYASPVLSNWQSFDGELPNRSSYLENIYSFNSDSYSSLGVVCVDVPQFSAINSTHGFEYGRQLLRHITKTLTDIFGRAMVYRTWDAEFVAVCPNTTQQVFFGHCVRLRSMLMRNYPKGVRMGYNWADKVFTGKALVDEARTLMQGSGFEGPNKNAASLPLALARHGTLKEMISAGCFTVYFQPKMDMGRGMLVGAEALVRGIDENRNAIPPVKFIEYFEQDGTIRDIDLFVLDRTMRLLDHWIRMGIEPVPVSLNFSRITLFDPRAAASVLAIQSRYPSVPPELIVVEITESAGDIGQSALRHAMESFTQFDVRFSLDDFGSKFSNLAVLGSVPFDEVKLDRSLVAEITTNETQKIMVKSVVDVCLRRGIHLVAEGVETAEQVDALLRAGCSCGQGYYYDRPMPVEMFFNKYLVGRLKPAKMESI